MSKPTDGPYEVMIHKDTGEIGIVAPKGGIARILSGSHLLVPIDREEALATADLFAASLEMLAALKFYANSDNWKEQETGIGMAPSDAEMDSGNLARAVIAKVAR
jgi:hypothetical protein